MAFTTGLQTLSDWITGTAARAKEVLKPSFKSVMLREALHESAEAGGVQEAILKLAAKKIPRPTADEKIAAALSTALLRELESEIKSHEKVVGGQIDPKLLVHNEVETKFAAQFTWLSVLSRGGPKPSRSWPVVGEFADLGVLWVGELLTLAGLSPREARDASDAIRGRILDALAQAVDKVVADNAVRSELLAIADQAGREALVAIAQQVITLPNHRLLGEVPQRDLFVPPEIKKIDPGESTDGKAWDAAPPLRNGDGVLLELIKQRHPGLTVIEGDMGSGKSCLMRAIAAKLGEQYLVDRRCAPVYLRWRDLYDRDDLLEAIVRQVRSAYGVPLDRVEAESNVAYLVDGFDEMVSHENSLQEQCFKSLSDLVAEGSSVVLSVRTSAVSVGLRTCWEEHQALVAQVQPFDADQVAAWLERWQATSAVAGVEGEDLKDILKGMGEADKDIMETPILLHMIAMHLHHFTGTPHASATRASIFRTFVDQTIGGKHASARHEGRRGHSDERQYRMLLQEMATWRRGLSQSFGVALTDSETMCPSNSALGWTSPSYEQRLSCISSSHTMRPQASSSSTRTVSGSTSLLNGL